MADVDMDIEMDLDIGLTEEELAGPYYDTSLDAGRSTGNGIAETPILNTPNDTSDTNSHDPAPEKVHLRGLDNLTTKDIKDFASEYYTKHAPIRVEWIDDTSANLIYETPVIAADALIAFSSVELADVTHLPALQTIPAKAFPLHPDTNLEVRLAVVGDRKQAGARERSRFYLFNPEHDPAERRKRGDNRSYRDRGDGGYRSQRYDDREQQKRERDADFSANLYDDDEAALAERRSNTDRRSPGSGSETRSRDSRRDRYRRGPRKELFPEDGGRGDGRLRDRSASPVRGSRDSSRERRLRERRGDEGAVRNREKAQLVRERLRDIRTTKELFPTKTDRRRPSAFDAAADETADLFSSSLRVPIVDGSADAAPLESRITWKNSGKESSGFSIRGAAKAGPAPTQSFSIKGAAKVKELFPTTFGDNSGKELFSERLESRITRRRQKAEDLFY